MLDPDPPHDPRWLDLTAIPGEPAVRIDLTRPPDTARVTAARPRPTPASTCCMPSRRGCSPRWPAPPDTGSGESLPGPQPLPAGAGGLGDFVAALQAAGALSPLSPVPGHLAALCARLNVSGHGLTAPPARDLPEPWLTVLAHYQLRKTTANPARDGCAAAAATLAELDGITLTILGLHTGQGAHRRARARQRPNVSPRELPAG